MKTLIITLLITLTSIFSNNILASANIGSTEEMSIIPIEIFSTDLNNNELEESLIIEDWMSNENFWKHANELSFQIEKEQALQIEDWMTNPIQWNANKMNHSNVTTIKRNNETVHLYRLKIEKERALTIESWMTDDNVWSL